MYQLFKFIFPALFFTTIHVGYTQSFVDTETPSQALPVGFANECNWRLDFSDEFNDNTIDQTKWTIDDSPRSRTGRPKIKVADWWWKPENVSESNGNLVLNVVKHDFNTMYCGAINSNKKYETQYGYFECRIKVGDIKKGTHSAFWLQGKNQGNIDGTANDGCEIDIFESAFDKPNSITKSVFHRDGYGKYHEALTKQYDVPNLFNGFHTFGMYWDENLISIYYDGVLKTTYSKEDRKFKLINGVNTDIDGKDGNWLVHTPEFLWLSNGASFGVTGDQYFVNHPEGLLTQTFVDYVRVWKGADSPLITEGESANLTTIPSSMGWEAKTSPSASKNTHARINFKKPGDQAQFKSVNIPTSGYYCLKIDGLTWVSFGQFKVAVKSKNRDWQTSDKTIDLFKKTSTLKTETIGPFYFEQGISDIKLICVGKNENSSNFTASLDKIELTYLGKENCINPNTICDLCSSSANTSNCNSGNINPFVFFPNNFPENLEEGYVNLALVANAFDTDGEIDHVDLKIDGKLVRSEKVAPFEWGHDAQNTIIQTELSGLEEGEHLLELIAVDTKGASSITSKTLNVTAATTLNTNTFSSLEDSKSKVRIFPNPSKNGIFNLNQNYFYEIFDTKGNRILSSEGEKIDLSYFSEGLYFVKINKSKCIKIVKQ